MRLIKDIIIGLGLFALPIILQAQLAVSPAETTAADSIVSLTAEAQGLPLVSREDLPKTGTFWLVTAGLGTGAAVPLPCPPTDASLPVFQMADGQFLVDGTKGQVVLNAKLPSVESALTAQADAVVNLIERVQETEMMSEVATLFGLELDSGGGMALPLFAVTDPDGLWLEITNLASGYVLANLHNATNQVYAIWGTTDLLTPWQVEKTIWPADTNCEPFTLATQNRQMLFLRAEDWTGKDSNADGVPDWWSWQYFGDVGLMMTNRDFANTNRTFGYDYSNNITPTVFGYDQLQSSNTYVNTGQQQVWAKVAGWPYYAATQVDNLDLTNAAWTVYSSSNFMVNLGMTEGWHSVWVGLRGHADAPTNAVWCWKKLKLDYTPPQILVTNLPSLTVSVPMIQIQGLVSEELSKLTYGVSNAVNVVTNLAGYISPVDYDTNELAFTTHSFQCYDIELTTNGINLITLHATDLAGNTTTTSFNVTVDYSTATTPQTATLWPPTGATVGGTNFVIQATVNDPTATVTVSIVDANGQTNTVKGTVNRNGQVLVNNIPLVAGANSVTVTTTGASGLSSTNSFTLAGNNVGLTLNPLPASQQNLSSVGVSGSIGDPSYSVTVNGVTAVVATNGTWTAEGVEVNPTGLATFDMQVRDGLGNLVAEQKSVQYQPATATLASFEWVVESHGHMTGHTEENNEPACSIPYWWIDRATFLDGIGGGEDDHWTWWDHICGHPAYVSDDYYEYPPHLAIADYAGYVETTDSAPDGAGLWTEYHHERSKVVITPGGQPVASGAVATYLVRVASYWTGYVPGPGYLYWRSLPLPPEWMQIKGQTLVNSGVERPFVSYDDHFRGTVWGETLVQAQAGVPVDITPAAIQVYYNWQNYSFDVQAREVNLQLAVDNNRDGQITFDGSDDTGPAKPFRFWINDDQDDGDVATSGSDIPGTSSGRNCADDVVNGRCDLLDFFPVALEVAGLLEQFPLTNGYEFHLSQADSAVNFLYNSLTPGNARDYLTNPTNTTGYGVNADKPAHEADTIQVTSAGVPVNTNWLAMAQTNGGVGILLAEGRAATDQPLMLEIWRNGQKLGGVPLHLKIRPVEDMYRWVGMRSAVDPSVTDQIKLGEPPNNPDKENQSGNFVFVHGYNVTEVKARAWNAEMFKRLWQSGSKAKFYAVDWNGNESYLSTFDTTPDYHTNVVNAFLTAPFLETLLDSLTGETTLAGHSLGNMVCLSAISDWGAQPARYFMIDAAVPMEAIDGSLDTMNSMVHPEWTDYTNRLWASKWFDLWLQSDARSTLTWSNRLANFGNVAVYNFYSSGEEVLREDTDAPPSGLVDAVYQNALNWYHDHEGVYTWAWQEKLKGRCAFNGVVGSDHGGWGFNSDYDIFTPSREHLPPERAATNTITMLQTNAFFDWGDYTFSSHPDFVNLPWGSGSTYAQANRNRILADAIPALTLPVGANHVTVLGSSHNFDMQALYESGWPASRPAREAGADAAGEWHHSDIKNIAYPYTYKLFNQIVDLGNLK